MENLGEYSTSKKGKRLLSYRGHEFWFHRNRQNGSTVWRCTKYRTCKCKATIVADDRVVIGEQNPQHSHEKNISHGLVKRDGPLRLVSKMILMDPRLLESIQQKPYVPPDTLNDSLRVLDMQMEHILNREDLSPHDKVKQYQKTLRLYTTRLGAYRNKALGWVDMKSPNLNTPTTAIEIQQEPSKLTTEPKKETIIKIPDSATKQTTSTGSKARPSRATHETKMPPSKRTRGEKTKDKTSLWDEWESK